MKLLSFHFIINPKYLIIIHVLKTEKAQILQTKKTRTIFSKFLCCFHSQQVDKTNTPGKERDITDYIESIDAPNTSATRSDQSSDEGDCDDTKVLRTKLK